MFRALIVFLIIVAAVGCERAQVPLPTIDAPMTDIESAPVKLISFIDYPEDQAAYIAWVASVVPILQAPEEVIRIRSYDNIDPDMHPNRLVEFEFGSFTDATAYLDRPEIAAVFDETPNRASNVIRHTFIEDADYTYVREEGDWQFKFVYFIDYVPAGRQTYLDWTQGVATVLLTPTHLKAATSYDNSHDASPHRLVEFEFASQEDAAAYYALDEVMQVAAETQLQIQAGNWRQVMHTFVLRSDYINE